MKAQDQIASQENSIKHAYPSKTLSKNCRGRNTPKLILGGHITLIPKLDKDKGGKEPHKGGDICI